MNKLKQQLITSALLMGLSGSVWAVNISVFGDTSFSASDAEGSESGFSLGAMDLYATDQIGENDQGFMELVVENDGEGFVVDLERLWIKHNFNPAFAVSAGRFHTPLGYWNATRHHGTLMQRSVSRPFFLDFEDGGNGILPVHAIGLQFSGDIALGSGGLEYKALIHNGPALSTAGTLTPTAKVTEIDPNNLGDQNGNKSVGGRISYLSSEGDLRAGMGMMIHDIPDIGGVKASGETLLTQVILSFDILYQIAGFELMAEVYSIQHSDVINQADTVGGTVGDTGSFSALAAFAQFSYNIKEPLDAYYRFETLDFEDEDSYFSIISASKQVQHLLGMRYWVDDSNAVKFEFGLADPDKGDSVSSVSLQWAFLIP